MEPTRTMTSTDVSHSPSNAWQTFQRVWPTALAIVPVSGLFGVLAAQENWRVVDVLLISLLGFTGSGQFALLPLASQGMGFLTMLLVAVSINCRYLPMAFVAARRLPSNRLQRTYLAHTLGDEAYALEKDSDSFKTIWIIRSTIFAAWVLSAVGGAFAAGFIPPYSIDPAINLGFPASVVLLYLSFDQLRARAEDSRAKRLSLFAGFSWCIAVICSAIALLGTTYFWIPSIVVCTWILWKVQA